MVFSVSPLFWISLIGLAGSGAGNTISVVFRGTSNQLLTPDELRGRVASFNSIFTMGGPQLGQFESGVLADLWGAEFSAGFGGAVVVLVALVVALVPSVRSFDIAHIRADAARVRPARAEPG